MSLVGKLLLLFGTVIGALGGARLPDAHWGVAGVGFAMLVTGGIALRVAGRSGNTGTGPELGIEAVREKLTALPDAVESLSSDATELELSILVERLTTLESQYLRPISEAAPGLLPVLGSARFAEAFGPYASGERLLARAWSAAADGHRAEALASLQSAVKRIREAKRGLAP